MTVVLAAAAALGVLVFTCVFGAAFVLMAGSSKPSVFSTWLFCAMFPRVVRPGAPSNLDVERGLRGPLANFNSSSCRNLDTSV